MAYLDLDNTGSDAEARVRSYHGVPYTVPARWCIASEPLLDFSLDLREIDTVCRFRRRHVRCCCTRTLLDARTAEAAHKEEVVQASSPDRPQPRSAREEFARVVGSLAEADEKARHGRRQSASVAQRRLPLPPPRAVVFRNQPPSVVRAVAHGDVTYTISGTIRLSLNASALSAHGGVTVGSARLPPFLGMAPSAEGAWCLQADPPSANTTDSSSGRHGLPQLLLLEAVSESRQRVDGSGRARRGLTATYTSFRWLLSPNGNAQASGRTTAKRQRGEDGGVEFREASSQPKNVHHSVALGFDVFVPTFASTAQEQRVCGEMVSLADPVVSRRALTRFAISPPTHASNNYVEGHDKEQRQRAARAVRKRVWRLRTKLAGSGSPDADRDAAVALCHIATIYTSAPIPRETCTELADTKCLASVLPQGAAFPRSGPLGTGNDTMSADAHLGELVEALASASRW